MNQKPREPLSGNAEGMQLTREFHPSARAAREARQFVRATLIDQVPAGTLADLLTIVSELVSNAVAHGEHAPIRVTLDWAPEEVSGEVANRGFIAPKPDMDRRGVENGLGLHIVNAIADEWHVSSEEGVTTVGFRQRF